MGLIPTCGWNGDHISSNMWFRNDTPSRYPIVDEKTDLIRKFNHNEHIKV